MSAMKTGYVLKVFLDSVIGKSYISLFTLLQTRNFLTWTSVSTSQYDYRFWTLHILIAEVNAPFSHDTAAHISPLSYLQAYIAVILNSNVLLFVLFLDKLQGKSSLTKPVSFVSLAYL